ncbi:MAG: PilN domain-containing protein [Candidatus Thiodiazotropha sp. (ex Lucinoma borealis)]|nr:PilN domain-containing protein [Candidatus Thiodiazotropha sp. (ex Lucinoma borealis)]MCU7866772.1 PilN domain-containing protein [Candidatus Thiodiazotropha sp. (ex Lucinoma borealis)]
MRPVSLNFVPGHKKQLAILSAVLCVVGLLLGTIGTYAAQQVGIYRNRLIPLDIRITTLRDEQQHYQSMLQDGPSPSDIETLSNRIKILSDRLKLNGLWIGDIFYELEATIPDKAYLLQFHYPYEGNTARIMVRAQNENVMSEALKRLEQNKRISNVVLAGQSREEEELQVIIADVRFSLNRIGR